MHTALCHAGQTRVSQSDVTIDGEKVTRFPPDSMCVGCALGGTRRIHRLHSSVRRPEKTEASVKASFFGQIVWSDGSTSYPPSFPHRFTGMQNFCDVFSGQREFYCLAHPQNPVEVSSAMRAYWAKVKHLLRDGKIWCWKTDNGSEYRGEAIDGKGGVVEDLVGRHEYSAANTKNTNPIPERAHGVIQRGIRACLAHAEAPDCLWSWAAAQCNRVYYYLATNVHSPPNTSQVSL